MTDIIQNGLAYQLPLRSSYFWTPGKTIKDTLRIISAHYYLNLFTRWGCKFTLPSLFLYASWIRHTSSGPALAVCFPISKYCTMGLLSRAFCGVPPCLNFENMAVAGIGDTRLRTAATQYRFGTLGLVYEQLNVAITLRSCVSSTDDRPIVFTLTCSERQTDRWGRHCSSAEYTFLYFQIFCGLSVNLTGTPKTLLLS